MEMIQDVQFITDNTGQKTFAIIPIDKYNSYAEYEKMMEDLEDKEDIQAIIDRKEEPSFLAEDVFKEIRQNRALNGQ